MIFHRYCSKPYQAACTIWPQCNKGLSLFKISAKSSECHKTIFGGLRFLTLNNSDNKYKSMQKSRSLSSYHHPLHCSLLLKAFTLSITRHYCLQRKDRGSRISLDNGSKLLENHPSIIWPSIIQMFRNLFIAYIIIKPYYDNTFKIMKFVNASAKAASKVSNFLSVGNFDALSELVDEKLIKELKEVYKQLSANDRLSLLFSHGDIMAKSLLIIGLIFEEPKTDNVKQKIFVELTTVYHVLHGFEKMTKYASPLSQNSSELDPSESMIINFRFLKELTSEDDSYIINSINYFKPLKAIDKDKKSG